MVGSDIFRRRGALLCAMAALAPVGALAAGCGGSSTATNDAAATALLDRAFAKGIRSADAKLSAQVRITGLPGLSGPISLDASGPFIAAKRQLPKLDMDVTVGAAGQGQALQTGFLSTGDRAFLKFGGEYYEQPRANVAQANRQLAQGRAGRQTTLGLSPKRWVRGATLEGEETIGGVTTEHVTAQVDVRAMLVDLNGLARRGTSAVGGAAPKPLSARQLDTAAATVQDPRFDVYVGKADGLIHRVSGSVSLSVPKADSAGLRGITGGSLRFTLDLANTNGNQTVKAPASARPISELSAQLGGAAALKGLLGGGAGTGTSTTPGATTPGGSGTSTTPDAAAFKRYSQCLDRARPDDVRALTRCRSELR